MLIYCTFMDECRLNICARPASPCLSLAGVVFIALEGPQRRGFHQECVAHDRPFFGRQVSSDRRRVGRTFCDHVPSVVSTRPDCIPPGTGAMWPNEILCDSTRYIE